MGSPAPLRASPPPASSHFASPWSPRETGKLTRAGFLFARPRSRPRGRAGNERPPARAPQAPFARVQFDFLTLLLLEPRPRGPPSAARLPPLRAGARRARWPVRASPGGARLGTSAPGDASRGAAGAATSRIPDWGAAGAERGDPKGPPVGGPSPGGLRGGLESARPRPGRFRPAPDQRARSARAGGGRRGPPGMNREPGAGGRDPASPPPARAAAPPASAAPPPPPPPPPPGPPGPPPEAAGYSHQLLLLLLQ